MNQNIKEAVEKRIETIELQEEYDEALTTYQTSDSPFKDEAIWMLKKAFPIFDKSEATIQALALKQIEDGRSDISDMGN